MYLNNGFTRGREQNMFRPPVNHLKLAMRVDRIPNFIIAVHEEGVIEI